MVDERFSEDDLRALLERAVPQLPAPVQRLERVKERARRRRRRAVGVSATAVVAVAAAGMVLPTLNGTSGAPVPPAVSTLEPPASGSGPTATGPTATDRMTTVPVDGTPTPANTVDPTEPPSAMAASVRHHFPELSGLDLWLPPGWHTITAPKADAVFASSQTLGLPMDGCVKPLDGFCTPLDRTLTPGGVLMMLTVRHNQLTVDKLHADGRPVTPTAVLGACRAVGGTAQTDAMIADASGSDLLVQVSVCLAGPTDAEQAQIKDALMSADFS